MSQLNKTRPVTPAPLTHGGSVAVHTNSLAQLERTVSTCLLWEDTFYEDGVSIADRIRTLVAASPAAGVAALAIKARHTHGLRHVPLLMVRAMLRAEKAHWGLVEETLASVVKRPDEMTEFMAIYWADNSGKKTVPWPVKRALARRLAAFDEYSLSKWDRRDKAVRMRDVMFLTHTKPADVTDPRKWDRAARKQARESAGKDGVAMRPWEVTPGEALLAKVTLDELKQFETWEDELSAGGDKAEVFTKLMAENKLGGLAFLRNLRGMTEAGIPQATLTAYAQSLMAEGGARLNGIFPYQYITAARNAGVKFEPILEKMMLSSLGKQEATLKGDTIVLVDVSGSMDVPLTKPRPNQDQSTMTTRIDAAAAVAIMAMKLCERARVFTFSERLVEVPPRTGMALRDAILQSQAHHGTEFYKSMSVINTQHTYDRIIVITDEQATDRPGWGRSDGGVKPKGKGYLLNVGTYQNGIGHGDWTTISGWSPHVMKYIDAVENGNERASAE